VSQAGFAIPEEISAIRKPSIQTRDIKAIYISDTLNLASWHTLAKTSVGIHWQKQALKPADSLVKEK
jgi:hypothetical protein